MYLRRAASAPVSSEKMANEFDANTLRMRPARPFIWIASLHLRWMNAGCEQRHEFRVIFGSFAWKGRMFRVHAESLQDYFSFDPRRKSDLEKLDALIKRAAPNLKRYFHRGTPAGEPGMRFKMIGYGRFFYSAKSGQAVEWPVVGVALQKNYISVYFAITKNGVAVTQQYAGRLGELRMGRNNFSFEKFDDLDIEVTSALIAETGRIFAADPDNPVRMMQE